MQRTDGELVLSPTDLTKHIGCPHITTLDLLHSQGLAQAGTPDDALELIFRLGLTHEGAYLQTLRDEGRTVTTIGAANGTVDRAGRELETLAALCTGVDVVYQGTFFDGRWGGQADFLLRVESRPSSGRGPTRSPTPSSPASSRCPHCCRWPPTPIASKCCRASRRGACRSSPATVSTTRGGWSTSPRSPAGPVPGYVRR